ncbi:hypothetical protein [Streptomyces sp. SID3343]|uniref:hypothetical protein n=1 Tax=Streptomyces sp. SID3343 TaxID=2690260 RepID=UPI00136B45FB|nr:hypothetical protein [Streptomyces sp. SID3343]MYW02518.1 hypothetical protein [Streptomyces sp. SID3343]
MSENSTTPTVSSSASEDAHRSIRVRVDGQPAMDVTRSELVRLQHAIRTYLQRTFPAAAVRRGSCAGG